MVCGAIFCAKQYLHKTFWLPCPVLVMGFEFPDYSNVLFSPEHLPIFSLIFPFFLDAISPFPSLLEVLIMSSPLWVHIIGFSLHKKANFEDYIL